MFAFKGGATSYYFKSLPKKIRTQEQLPIIISLEKHAFLLLFYFDLHEISYISYIFLLATIKAQKIKSVMCTIASKETATSPVLANTLYRSSENAYQGETVQITTLFSPVH